MEMQSPQPNLFAKAVLITGVAFALGLCYNYLFYDKIPGISFPLFITLVVAGLFTVSACLKRKITSEAWCLLLPLAFFSSMVFFRSSELLTILNIGASLSLLFVIAEAALAAILKDYAVRDYIKIFFVPFKFFRPLLQTLSDVFSLRGVDRNRESVSQVVKGIALAVPLLIVFALLFSSADLIFQKYISKLFHIELDRVSVVLIATLVFIGAYAYIFRETHEAGEVQQREAYTVGPIETSIVLGSVNALFFVFILVQIAYLFGGESSLSILGFTYAEYARRGFFELIAVAVISLVLLWTFEKYIVKSQAGHTVAFKLLSGALIVQVLVIMCSAFKRLLLYEEAYGFTSLRLYSHSFIILLGLILTLLLYKIFMDKRENLFAFGSFIAIVLYLAGMNLLNPDAFVARCNIDRYAQTGKIDVDYLSRLSDDGLQESVKSLGLPNADVRSSFAHALYWRARHRAELTSYSGWQAMNLSRINAAALLSTRMPELEPYRNYQPQIKQSPPPHE